MKSNVSPNIQIMQANINYIDKIIPLFQGYRKFYDVELRPEEEENFLRIRLEKQESEIFLAMENEIAVGFTQLYPSFSSLSLRSVWILNDLYVEKTHRRQGIGQMLLEAAKEFALKTKSKGLTLNTSIDNSAAQSLYEKFGFTRNDHFYEYFLFF